MVIKRHINRAIAIFAGLAIAGISMVVAAQVVPQSFAQMVLVAVGSAIFGAGLAFFLVRITMLTE